MNARKITAAARRAPTGRPVSSGKRMLALLDLFTEQQPHWTVEGMAAEARLSRTTAYRYAKTLVDGGLLRVLNAGTYVLGARIIELDRTIRVADPLLRVAPPHMDAIRHRAGGIVLLCSYYGDHVMCIHDVRVDPEIFSGYERGRPFPLFRGAPSRIILPYLPRPQLKSLMLHHAGEIARAGWGENWREFDQRLRAIREQGYYAAPGELHPDSYGISAPILHREGVAGSLTLGRRTVTLKDGDIAALVKLAVATAAKISAEIQAE